MTTLAEFAQKYGLFECYNGYDPNTFPLDIQGWSHEHPLFAQIIGSLKPTSIIEVGSHKGASAINIMKPALEIGLSPTMVCVDTWLNNQQWADPELRGRTCAIGGQLKLMQQFMTNITLSDMSKFIAPYPQTSVQAARVMQKEQVLVDLIYHDASNEEEDIYNDLTSYWPLIRKGGMLFGTDYMSCWPGEVRAINRFCAENSLILRTIDPKWFIYKT